MVRGTFSELCARFMIGLGALATQSAVVMISAPSAIAYADVIHTAQETVMVVGGSAAHGWADPNDDSYLQRAFASLTDHTDTQYVYDDRTVVGGEAVNYDVSVNGAKNAFQVWLNVDKPQVVAISWGLLNDASNGTDPDAFKQAITDEINESLAVHAVVLVITPPVVTQTVDGHDPKFNALLADEHEVVTSLNNPNVYWIDLYRQTSENLAKRHIPIDVYSADSWHPSEAGHAEAGTLLYKSLESLFGSNAITYRSSRSMPTTTPPEAKH